MKSMKSRGNERRKGVISGRGGDLGEIVVMVEDPKRGLGGAVLSARGILNVKTTGGGQDQLNEGKEA